MRLFRTSTASNASKARSNATTSNDSSGDVTSPSSSVTRSAPPPRLRYPAIVRDRQARGASVGPKSRESAHGPPSGSAWRLSIGETPHSPARSFVTCDRAARGPCNLEPAGEAPPPQAVSTVRARRHRRRPRLAIAGLPLLVTVSFRPSDARSMALSPCSVSPVKSAASRCGFDDVHLSDRRSRIPA